MNKQFSIDNEIMYSIEDVKGAIQSWIIDNPEKELITEADLIDVITIAIRSMKNNG